MIESRSRATRVEQMIPDLSEEALQEIILKIPFNPLSSTSFFDSNDPSTHGRMQIRWDNESRRFSRQSEDTFQAEDLDGNSDGQLTIPRPKWITLISDQSPGSFARLKELLLPRMFTSLYEWDVSFLWLYVAENNNQGDVNVASLRFEPARGKLHLNIGSNVPSAKDYTNWLREVDQNL